MNLYLRVALGMVLAMVLSVVAVRFLVAEPVRNKQHRMRLEQSALAIELFAEQMRAGDRARVLEALNKRFGAIAQIESPAESPIQVSGDAGVFGQAGGDWYVGARIDSDSLLIAGPLPDTGKPNAADGILGIVASLAVVLVTSLLVVLPIGRRMRALDRATRRLRDGDLSARVEVAGGGAVGRLADNINHMAEEIERLLENQKQLLQAVSHELRTPTARIRFSLEMLESASDPAIRQKRLDEIDRDLVELDSLVEELLTYIRFDDGKAPELKTERIDVAPVLTEIVRATEVLGDRIDISVVDHDAAGDRPSGCTVLANRRYFRRVVENLVRNAIRHANRKVNVEYQTVGGHVLLLVHDDGPGVPPDERDRVWEPFARLDPSRSRDSGGFGLGLAIVMRIMDWHGGQAKVEKSQLGGAMFVTSWPAEEASALADGEVVIAS